MTDYIVFRGTGYATGIEIISSAGSNAIPEKTAVLRTAQYRFSPDQVYLWTAETDEVENITNRIPADPARRKLGADIDMWLYVGATVDFIRQHGARAPHYVTGLGGHLKLTWVDNRNMLTVELTVPHVGAKITVSRTPVLAGGARSADFLTLQDALLSVFDGTPAYGR